MAKVILIGEHLRVGRDFEDRPLIVPTLYKSFLFTVCAAVLSMLEAMIRGFLQTGNYGGAQDALMGTFSYEWFAGMLAIFVIFIPFFAIRELGKVLGEGRISDLFFRKKVNQEERR